MKTWLVRSLCDGTADASQLRKICTHGGPSNYRAQSTPPSYNRNRYGIWTYHICQSGTVSNPGIVSVMRGPESFPSFRPSKTPNATEPPFILKPHPLFLKQPHSYLRILPAYLKKNGSKVASGMHSWLTEGCNVRSIGNRPREFTR